MNNADCILQDNITTLITNDIAKGSSYEETDNPNINGSSSKSNKNDIVDKDIEKANVDTALLGSSEPVKQPRYGTSEFNQFLVILSRALLFSRRDWVSAKMFIE